MHRGVHSLSARATFAYERARGKVHKFLNAPDMHQIIFTRGTTEAINLVAQSWGRANLGPGDEVLITEMEHHSNIVPWQIVCEQTGRTLGRRPVTDDGELDMDAFEKQAVRADQARRRRPHLERARAPSIRSRRSRGSPTRRAPWCWSTARRRPRICKSTCRTSTATSTRSRATRSTARPASACSTARRELLEAMPPWQGGGEMILSVSFEKTTYNELPYKFEAGTPAIAAAIGLGAAIDYLGGFDFAALAEHEHDLLVYAGETLGDDSGPPHHRHGQREDRRALVRDRRRAPARHRHDPRPRGHRDPHRPPLRAADHAPFRAAGHRARVVRDLQHARRHRSADRRARVRQEDDGVGMSDLRELYQEVILDHSKRPRNFGRLPARRTTPTATTRCAATRSTSRSSSTAIA